MNSKASLIQQLRQNLLKWEGYNPPAIGTNSGIGLGEIENAFPNNVFPVGAVHEFVCDSNAQAAATGGYISAILSRLMQKEGICVWIVRSQCAFAPGFALFGVNAHRIIFITLQKDKEAIWVMEEALKCSGLTAVICELSEMDFKQSRRLQLAVEHSHVTGFVLRNSAGKLGSTACAARWQIRSLPSSTVGDLPGLGYFRWEVELLKVRNGETGKWQIEWRNNHIVTIKEFEIEERQVG